MLGRCPDDCGADPPVPRYRDRSYARLPASPDQARIEAALPSVVTAASRVLHVGVGSSSLARALSTRVAWIDGITLLEDERAAADACGLPNYHVRVLDKYGPGLAALPGRYDVIVDNNPGTWACCRRHLHRLFEGYAALLAPDGRVLTDARGATWPVRGGYRMDHAAWVRMGQRHALRAAGLTGSVWALYRD